MLTSDCFWTNCAIKTCLFSKLWLFEKHKFFLIVGDGSGSYPDELHPPFEHRGRAAHHHSLPQHPVWAAGPSLQPSSRAVSFKAWTGRRFRQATSWSRSYPGTTVGLSTAALLAWIQSRIALQRIFVCYPPTRRSVWNHWAEKCVSCHPRASSWHNINKTGIHT